jgi:hypothetical protein
VGRQLSCTRADFDHPDSLGRQAQRATERDDRANRGRCGRLDLDATKGVEQIEYTTVAAAVARPWIARRTL